MAQDPERPPDFRAEIVEKLGAFADLKVFASFARGFASALAEVFVVVLGWILSRAQMIATLVIRAFNEASSEPNSERGKLIAASLENIFQVQLSPTQYERLGGGDGRAAARAELTRVLVRSLTGGSESIAPSTDPANRYLEVIVGQQLEGWFTTFFFEMTSALMPGMEQVQTAGEISSKLAVALGLSDSSARVLRPYIDNLVVEPLRRAIDEKYRPSLLSPGDCARNLWRGRLGREDAFQELRWQGWSDDKIEMLLSAGRRMLAPSDVRTLLDRGAWTQDDATQHLRDQGYDAATAADVLALELIHRKEQHERAMAAEGIAAYVGGVIAEPRLRAFLDAAVVNAQERGFLLELATARRIFRGPKVSLADFERAVKAGIRSMADYRGRLADDGFSDDDVTTLELLLRTEIADVESRARIRTQREAEAIAAAAAREATRASQRAAIEAERAVTEPSLSQVETAYIRGVIERGPFAGFLADAKYDADTIAFLLDLADQRADEYRETIAHKAAAALHATRRDLSIAQLERAVLAGVLTMADYAARLQLAGFASADIGILRAGLDADLARRREAETARDRIDAVLNTRGVSLADFARALRHGVRTLDDYRRFLAGEGFDLAAQGLLVELAQADLALVAETARARQAALDAVPIPSFSLAQLERAVLAGVRTLDEYDRQLVSAGYGAGDRATLLAVLRGALADAETARAKRAAIAAATAHRDVTLAQMERGVKLGVRTLDEYAAFLAALGYGLADQQLLAESLYLEVAELSRARAARDARDTTKAGDTETALRARVLAGQASEQDYVLYLEARGDDRTAIGESLALLDLDRQP